MASLPDFDSNFPKMVISLIVKIAVTGKGGVGKTTIAASLSHVFSREGKRVLAVDADPDANLASAFGLSHDEISEIKPIAEMTDLIAERTGAMPGAMGGIFKLNPRVDDIPDEFGKRVNGITLLITGRSKGAASGCFCPENVLLRRLIKHLVVERDEVVIIDMEAGIEHLTRGTASAVDAFIIVTEPGGRSIQTALTIRRMAEELGIKKLYVVANKITSENDMSFIKQNIGDMTLAGRVSFNPAIIKADMEGTSPFNAQLIEEIKEIKKRIEGD